MVARDARRGEKEDVVTVVNFVKDGSSRVQARVVVGVRDVGVLSRVVGCGCDLEDEDEVEECTECGIVKGSLFRAENGRGRNQTPSTRAAVAKGKGNMMGLSSTIKVQVLLSQESGLRQHGQGQGTVSHLPTYSGGFGDFQVGQQLDTDPSCPLCLVSTAKVKSTATERGVFNVTVIKVDDVASVTWSRWQNIKTVAAEPLVALVPLTLLLEIEEYRPVPDRYRATVEVAGGCCADEPHALAQLLQLPSSSTDYNRLNRSN
ncbi:hypothetical protein G7046_g3705 [Stylonectria norvegica]|nr:hypothetical protein G7046_g3705 [Stylonectria norvegica]